MSAIEYTLSFSSSRRASVLTRNTYTWAQFTELLATPRRTAETMAEYAAMSKEQRGAVKDVGAFVAGTFRGNKRKKELLEARCMVTLDFDAATPDTIEALRDSEHCVAVYSTHSYTPKEPRVRAIFPLTAPIEPALYEPLARALASEIDIEAADTCSFSPAQLMYLPGVSCDGEYLFFTVDEEPVNPQELLSLYYNTPENPAEWFYASGEEHTATPWTADGTKPEDPRAKKGLVGNFCRAYGIDAAIEQFLPDYFVSSNIPGRYTYKGGSSVAGAVVYDNLWLYSYHNTDPYKGRLLNAFDLVRLHKFGTLDVASSETDITRLPSYEAMMRFAAQTDGVTKLRAACFLDDDDDGAENTPEAQEQLASVMAQLDCDKKGKPYPNAANVRRIIRNDGFLNFSAVRHDRFSDRTFIAGKLPWSSAKIGELWSDTDDGQLRSYIARKYGITNISVIEDEKNNFIADCCSYHAVTDYLDRCVWDGKPRLDTLFIRTLGAVNTPLTRTLTRKSLCAAVARVYTPGCKFDNITVLKGGEGIGKSTLLARLGGKWFSDSLCTVEGKEAMEAIQGKWIIEIAELQALKRSEITAVKSFVSKQSDSFRAAYARNAVTRPRQCVFFATTNEQDILSGYTGNRRYWIIECAGSKVATPSFDLTQDEIDQVWAEAKYRFQQGESLFLTPEDTEELKNVQVAYRTDDPRKSLIENFLRTPVPSYWYEMDRADRLKKLLDRPFNPLPDAYATPPERSRLRDRISGIELFAECFQRPIDKNSTYEVRGLLDIVRTCEGWEDAVYAQKRDKAYGAVRCLVRTNVPQPASAEELTEDDQKLFAALDERPF